ncbi:MAG TPA: hypothetical protein VG142_01455 [Trebonia sp.]|nr:hypothetical protein [Trebonia sp.]
MNTMIKVARYHLLTPVMLLGLPWACLAAVFAWNVVRGGDHFRSGLVVLFGMFFVTGLQRVGRWLPFGLALGATRRSFYAGTALLGVSMSLVSGLVMAGLQAIERATGGWGLSITFFRVPYVLNGPWYATWLTSFVGLSALFVYGMWYGIVNRRWGTLGLIAFIAVQVLVAFAVKIAYSQADVGPLRLRPAGQYPATLSALGLTGVIAALTVVCLVGGHATIRRVTV